MKTILENIKKQILERKKFYEDAWWKAEPVITVIDEETGEPARDENDEIIRKDNTDYYEYKARKSEDNVILRDIVIPAFPEDCDDLSDGYHTFKELYDYRMVYNAAMFNLMAAIYGNPYNVHKSKKHDDGEVCFDGDMFIVQATLPTGQISNHYNLKYWDLFNIPEKEKADKWDGHTPQDAFERLTKYCKNKFYPLQWK